MHRKVTMDLLADIETSKFCKERDQMGLDDEVVQGFLSENIVYPLDLAEFEKEKIETAAKNLRKPKSYRMTHPDQDYEDEGMTIQKPGLKF